MRCVAAVGRLPARDAAMTLRLALAAAAIVTVGSASLFAPSSAQAASLRAYAGVVAGIAQATGGGPFACATSGPTIGDGYYAGVSLPTEGFAGCSLSGGIDDRVSASGPLQATQTGSASFSTGGYTGSARARADYWSLGVKADGTMTTGTSPFTWHESAAFASFRDRLTLQKAGVATGTAGYVNFGFLVEGAMSSLPKPPYTQQGDIALGIRVGDLSRGSWYAFIGTVINQDQPFLRGGSTGLPGGFISVPGGFSGAASVLSTANFGIQWGVPFDVEVALFTKVAPCCFGTSLSSDFEHTARLDAIQAGTSSGAVGDFTVLSQSGAALGPAGLAPVPEPSSWALWAAGALAMAGVRRHRRPADSART